MPTAPTPVTAAPTTPDRTDRPTFSARATAWADYQKVNLVPEINALGTNVYNNAVGAAADAATAVANANTATAAATAAATSASAPVWVSGTTYAIGDVRYSPANGAIYRRSTVGAGTTDPSSDSANWTPVAQAGNGFRNRIINGAMVIDQRNEGAAQTFTAAAALAYCVDRWYGYCTGANVTGQRVAGSGQSQYRYRFTGAASVTAIGFAQRIEASHSYDLNGRACMLGVDLANSVLTTVTWAAYYANTADAFGTLGSPTRTAIASGSFTVTSTVARYTASIAVPSAATTGIEIVFAVGAQTSGTWTIGNVQLEPGATASAFESKPVWVDQEMCARYLPVTREYYLAGQCYATNTAYVGCSFNVPARVAPTGLTLSASVGSYSITNATFTPTACSGISFGAASIGGGTAACTVAGTPLVAGNATMLSVGTNKILWTGCEL